MSDIYVVIRNEPFESSNDGSISSGSGNDAGSHGSAGSEEGSSSSVNLA